MRPLLVMLLTLAATGAAETAEGTKFFRLDFTIREMESGKAINARTYSVISSTERGPGTQLRTGLRLPITEGTTTRFSDVGVSIDCRALQEIGGELAMSLAIDISSLASDGPQAIVRQNKWNSLVIVPLRKPTLVFSSDDPGTKRQMQLEVTASPVK